MNNNNEFNSFSLINYIWQRRKLFLILCGAAAVLSFFFSTSLFISPQFKATTIIYAPRTNAVSKIINSQSNNNERLDIKAYALEEETEQIMQILNSREIKDVLIERYDLATYYGIDVNSKGWKTKLYTMLDGFLQIKRTQYGAISITVTDWDPNQAAQMANDIASELDTIKNRVEHLRAAAAVRALENHVALAEEQRKILEDSLEVLAQRGVFYYEKQSDRLMQQYAIALAQGNMAGVQRLQKELEKLEKWGNIAYSLNTEQMNLSEEIAFTKLRLLNAKMDMSAIMPVKFVLEKAVAPDKKSYPKKLLIVILATIGTFIVTLMTFLFVDKVRKEITIEGKTKNPAKKE